MVFYRQAGENDPPGGVLDKALDRVDIVFIHILDVNRLISVIHAGRRAEEDRSLIFFRKSEGFLDHFISFRHRRRIKYRHLGKHSKGPRVLLRLRGDRSRIIRHQNDHAALYADILQAHERVGRHIQADLLHGHERAGSCISRAGCHFHAGFLIDRPLYIYIAGISLSDRLQNFRRRCSGIARDQIYAGCQRAEGDRLVSHKKFLVHVLSHSFSCH